MINHRLINCYFNCIYICFNPFCVKSWREL
nr:MAG TPA: hypothetical protein [Bacteriophage sp.]